MTAALIDGKAFAEGLRRRIGELAARFEREAGRKARFWLRDDDAVEPTEALEKLIAATKAKSVPLALAVIPAQTGDVLAKRLSGETLVSVAVMAPGDDAEVSSAISPTGVSKTNGPTPLRSARATAVATVAWPQKSTSASGLKKRSRNLRAA